MSEASGPRIREVDPAEAWDALKREPDTALIDVRTAAEWQFVGVPDLAGLGKATLMIEWQAWPDMSENRRFAEQVLEELGEQVPSKLFFICRSGARSLRAAACAADLLAAKGFGTACVNVREGFEGDLDAQHHRGQQNGWKSRGLDWRQS